MNEAKPAPAMIPLVPRVHRPVHARLGTITHMLVVLTLIAVLATCYLAREVLAPIVLALLLSLLLSPVVGAVERLRLPRALCSALVVLSVVAIAFAGIAALAQPARDWVAKAPSAIHSVQTRLASWHGPMDEARRVTESLERLAQPGTDGPTAVVVRDRPSVLSGIVSSTPRALEGIAVVILLVFFCLSSGDNFLRRLVEIAPTMTEKRTVVSIARDVEREISRYLVTITMINLGLGAATAVAAALLGVPNALLWGALAAVLNFAPYVGAAITGITLGAVGFATFDSLAHALAVPGAFFTLAFIEGQLVTPTVIGRRLALNPVVVFVWLLIWGWLWGIVGVLLAGPMLACFRIVCQHTEALRPVYVLIGDVRLDDDKARGD
ncbi:MAG TPA: AI-2E family transporter [Dokdonella sp.]